MKTYLLNLQFQGHKNISFNIATFLILGPALLLSNSAFSNIDSIPARTDSLYIHNINVIDGNGDDGIANVLIINSVIHTLSDSAIEVSCQSIDGSGKSLMPGLIEGHAHVSHTPAQNVIIESDSLKLIRYKNRLKAYLAWGITTVVDPGISLDNGRIFRELEKNGDSPNLVFVGPIIGPHHGYPSAVLSGFPAVGSKGEVDSLVSAFEELNPIGLKITMEDGPITKIWPLHSSETKALIDSMRTKGGKKLFIHAMDKKMTKKALEMNPHVLVHGSKNGGSKLAKKIARQEAYVVTTSAIYGAPLFMWHPEWLNTDMIKLTTPPDELKNVTDSAVIARFELKFKESIAPHIPLWIAKKFNNEKYVAKKLKGPIKMIRKFNNQGVKLVLGSDAGGWPILPYMLHGVLTHLEIDQLLMAGLSPLEIIRAATITASEMIGKSTEIGTVEVGKNADLIIVEGNPLENIRTLHKPLWVIINGECRSPERWMSE